MKYQSKIRKIFLSLGTIMLIVSSVVTTELSTDLPSNHKDGIAVTPQSSMLKMEARDENDGFDVDSIEPKSRSSSVIFAEKEKPNVPQIFGSTSKVAVVYSEHNPIDVEKIPAKPIATKVASMEERNRRKPIDTNALKSKKFSDERNRRVVKITSRDSYLDALDHSHSSKDPREGIIRQDANRQKVSKLIRRDYHEGPVYRPSSEQYGVPKEPISHYEPTNNDDNHVASNNFARISYAGPTEEPFLPTPSNSYSLPIQSSAKFNDNHYAASPQVSYGSPQQPQTNYGIPSNRYGPPQNSYGPPANSYINSGANQQAYGPPSPTYGAPYANQDYTQHLPSLSSIGFSWPIALKLNVFTLAKILLKLVIFKMIVKFIAVICLLLFIPKLEIIKNGDKDDNGDDDDDDDSRRLLRSDSSLERLNILTALVTSSIEKYNQEAGKMTDSNEECTSFGCRVRKFITFDQSWNDYAGLFKNYVVEEMNNNDEAEKTVSGETR